MHQSVIQHLPLPAGAEYAEDWQPGDIEFPPKVWLDQPGDLNSDQARELASLLLELAAQIDGWVQR